MTGGTGTEGAGSAPLARIENNFHLLRLVLAFLVVLYHLVVLSSVPGWQGAMPLASAGAEIGVQGFFVLSGYLVYGSYERSRSLKLYAEKRVRRLYPAYAAIILASTLFALIVSPESRADLIGVLRYLGSNLIFLNFLEPELPGLFAANSHAEVNGALWTLKIEVMFYLLLPLLAWLLQLAGRWRWALIAAIYIAAEFWRVGLVQLAAERSDPTIAAIGRQLPGQVNFFITGVAFYLLRERMNWRLPLIAGGFVVLAASFLLPAAEPLRAIGLGVVLLWFATGLQLPVNTARFGDLSYGLYIIHFPVIQAFTAAGLFAAAPWGGATASIAVSLVLALLLWRYVERPFLRPDSAYRRAPNPD